MEQIIQLKSMRDEALERLQNNPDFKLVNSLDSLIRDLEAVLVPATESVVEETIEQPQEIETDTDSFEIAATGEEANVAISPDPVETSPDTGLSDAVSADADIDAGTAGEPGGETVSAIEALEAELSQSDVASDDVAAQPGSMIN